MLTTNQPTNSALTVHFCVCILCTLPKRRCTHTQTHVHLDGRSTQYSTSTQLIGLALGLGSLSRQPISAKVGRSPAVHSVRVYYIAVAPTAVRESPITSVSVRVRVCMCVLNGRHQAARQTGVLVFHPRRRTSLPISRADSNPDLTLTLNLTLNLTLTVTLTLNLTNRNPNPDLTLTVTLTLTLNLTNRNPNPDPDLTLTVTLTLNLTNRNRNPNPDLTLTLTVTVTLNLTNSPVCRAGSRAQRCACVRSQALWRPSCGL